MIRLLATTALGLVLANAAFAQSPSTATKSEQTPQAQSKSTAPSTTSPSSTADTQRTTSQPQQSPATGTSAQNAQSTAPSGAANSSTSNNAANSADTSRPQSGTANSNAAGNQPASQQSANPPPANTNQAQDRSNPPPANSNQAQQAPAASGTNQAQQAPNAPTGNQAQGERTGTGSQAAAQTDVNLNRQQETKISTSISHLNVQPLTRVNFSLNVGTVVPRDVHLSTLPPDVVEIVPQYRGYSFALVKDQIVVVDPATYKIVTVLPYSGQSTATTTTTTRERSASKFSDRDREVIRKHAKTRTEGRSEARTTGSTARTEIHVGDRVPDSVEVEELPSTVYRDAPDLREYRYIHRDSRTYVIEPRERRVIEEID
ncbi:DUF1236 domain-containing protein [Bradyrhizobium sp. UNPA324]|uniref:DUF1236 domain-containing protein n=1 Tax=Bradyrhizobium sp. UNPA324 TaxID=1141174 RepID=UPI0011545A19|nr:DUF1236 domain-containing protein [Bradyrhizobium sp. UNPA324]TQF32349.1 hypothetical protein UNPA324_24185 [Bradyrhizobium sp. UNPA324]